jgi:hypothetical protein
MNSHTHQHLSGQTHTHEHDIIDGPHWHRGSVYPAHYTAEEMRDDNNIELSNAAFNTSAEAMDIVGIMTQWLGANTSRWAGWSIKSSTVRTGAVKMYRDKSLDDQVIYFPFKCDGTACDHKPNNDLWRYRG